MIECIRRHIRCVDNLERVEKTAYLELRNTPRGDKIKEWFIKLSKPRVFSDEASFAMMLLIYSNVILDEVQALIDPEGFEGEHYPDTMLRFGLISSLKPLILQMERAAPDRERWSAEVGDKLKYVFDTIRKQMKDRSEARSEQAMREAGSAVGENLEVQSGCSKALYKL